MRTPEWLKPVIVGAVIGAAALGIFGFSVGGWMTAGKSQIVAETKAHEKMVAALVPICVEQSMRDPQHEMKIEKLKAAASYKRNEMLMQTGWATMPGSEEPDRIIAGHCMDKLEESF